MIQIGKTSITIEFRKGPATNSPDECIKFAMEILNLSKGFSSILSKGKIPCKKMNKTSRIRQGIQRLVNKTDLPPSAIDELICLIRNGKIKEITVKLGNKKVSLLPNNDIPGLIAELMLKKMI